MMIAGARGRVRIKIQANQSNQVKTPGRKELSAQEGRGQESTVIFPLTYAYASGV